MSERDTGRIEAVLYAGATVAGSVAVLFFAFNVRFPVSPVTKVVALATVGLWLVLLGQFAETQTGVVASYVLGVVSVSGGCVQLVGLLSLGSAGIAVVLAAVAVLFAGGARWLRVGTLQPLDGNRRASAVLTGVGVVVVVGVLLLDVVTGGIMFTLMTVDTAQPTDSVDPVVRVGTVTVTNAGPVPYGVAPPQYQACLAGDWSDTPVDQRRLRRTTTVEGSLSGTVLAGGERATSDLRVVAPREITGSRANLTGVPVVETEHCPPPGKGSRRIAVYSRQDGGIRRV